MKANCLAKLICDKRRAQLVVGLHFIGPNAGEVLQVCIPHTILLLKNLKEHTRVAFFVFGWQYIQGFSLAIKMGATKHDFDRLVC